MLLIKNVKVNGEITNILINGNQVSDISKNINEMIVFYKQNEFIQVTLPSLYFINSFLCFSHLQLYGQSCGYSHTFERARF